MSGALQGLVIFFLPAGAVVESPVNQGSFEADIMASFFAFEPFVTMNLVALGQEFLIKRGIGQQSIWSLFCHWIGGFAGEDLSLDCPRFQASG